MNKLLQASLVATLMSAGSTVVFAGNDTDKWAGCTELGCSKDIPIKLTVPKKCIISDPKDLVLKTDGVTIATSSYTVTTNTPYVLNLTTANANVSPNTFVKNSGGNTIDTVITTAKISGSAGPAAPSWGNNNYAGLSADSFTVSARTKAAVSATAAAGDYSDTYKIKVYY